MVPIQVSEDQVAKAILSFPCGSAGGPDGLRPQHLKDMIGNSAQGGGPVLLQSLTSFVNHVLRGLNNIIIFIIVLVELVCYPARKKN